MPNKRGYAHETNCCGMIRTSSKLQRAQRVHRACRICIHANEPATAWADTPKLIYCIIPLYYVYENGAWRLVDQKRYAERSLNFETGWIWCSGTFLYYFHVHKRNVRHVTTRKGRGTSLYTCTVEECQLPTLVVPLLSVRVTYNTKKTFSTFSRDLSRSLTLIQHCT